MSYICKNPDCSAPENKKGKSYPSPMECPFCDAPLVEVSSIAEADLQLIEDLPYVIAYPLQRMLNEKHAWTRINLFKDTFLNYLKYLGLLTASEFFNSPLKDKKMVALFHQTLTEPSFGTWNQYIREALKFLTENCHGFFCPELSTYYASVETGKSRKLYKGEIEVHDGNGDIQLKKQEATAIGMLINFRNRYLGHGLTLDEAASQLLFNDYFPIFRTLLEQLKFPQEYRMFKHEHGESYVLQSAALRMVEKGEQIPARVWIENAKGESMDILPFFVVPGEVSIGKEDKEQILTYESYTGKTIKFFSPEGTEKQTSGKILERLNLLLRDKQKEQPHQPQDFTRQVFLSRIAEENKLILDTLIAEKKVIPGVYVHREEMEIKLREWIGARASILFIAAEAGSGKTNLLVEMQRQYTERELPSLLIRAGRMEKPSLKQQIAWLLNLDIEQGLENYPAMAGTQASPTFILIDGLNEANNAEALWDEIPETCRCFEPGSLKFVVTSRATSKKDIERYALPESSEGLLYGENKENEKGLSPYTHWLTALNMAEMKGAWEGYSAKDKSRFKPQFSFDDLAGFDRALYGQISNPLVLRLFLETYHGKSLPGKGSRQLNIWKDWLARFSDQEQLFLTLLADAVWEKGENELPLDEVLKHETLRPWFTTDLVNAPYPRLKNNGWISRYVKDLNACVAFTVEGALLYLLGVKLQNYSPALDVVTVQGWLLQESKLTRSAIGTFLNLEALKGNLSVAGELIDTGSDDIEVCIDSLLIHIKTFGAQPTIKAILAKPTDNDWRALFALDKRMADLELNILRKEFLAELMPHNSMQSKEALWLALKAVLVFENDLAESYLKKINLSGLQVADDPDLLLSLGDCEDKFGNYDEALKYYIKCSDRQLRSLSGDHPHVALILSSIGTAWDNKGEYDKALEYFQKALDIRSKAFGKEHPDVAASYNYIGLAWDNKCEYQKALRYYQNALDIRLISLGEEHPAVATSYNNLGSVWNSKGNYDKALEFYNKALNIRLKILGAEHPDVASSYNDMGLAWNYKKEYNTALEFYHKGLEIRQKTLGDDHPDVATSYNNIGLAWDNKGDSEKALEYYQKCLNGYLKSLGEYHPWVATAYYNIGTIQESRGSYHKALELYEKCLVISIKCFGEQHEDVAATCFKKGQCLQSAKLFPEAIDAFRQGLSIQPAREYYFQIAVCHEALVNMEDAFKNYILSATFSREDTEAGLEDEMIKKAVENARRLAPELGKENELPEWMKGY